MDFKHRLKRYSRLRFAIFYPLTAYLVFFSSPDERSLFPAFVFLVMGVALRLWSNGYAIKMGKLTTSGPYGVVRNPLYLGTMLIALGIVVLLREYWLGAIFAIVMGFTYRRTIMQEEKMLEERFGADYRDYKGSVPGLWPGLRVYAKGEKWPFSWQRLWESREHKIVLWVIITVIAFELKKDLVVDRMPFSITQAGMITGLVLLVMTDIGLEYFKRHCMRKAVS
jgi:hypothetical protein